MFPHCMIYIVRSDYPLRSLKSVIFVWLDTYPHDFNKPPEFESLRTLHEFALKHIPDSDLAQRVKLKLTVFSKEDSDNDSSGKDSDENAEDSQVSDNGSPGISMYYRPICLSFP